MYISESYLNEFTIDMSKNKEFSKGLITRFKAMSDTRFKQFMTQISKSKSMTILIPPFKSPAYKEIMAAKNTLRKSAKEWKPKVAKTATTAKMKSKDPKNIKSSKYNLLIIIDFYV